jgi:hypothetical protein
MLRARSEKFDCRDERAQCCHGSDANLQELIILSCLFDVLVATRAYVLGLYWLRLAIDRLLVARLYQGTQHGTLLLVLTLISIAPRYVALTSTNLLIVSTSVLVLGVILSAISLLIIIMVGSCFSDVQSMALDSVSGAGTAGPLSFLFIMAPIATHYAIATAL